MDLNSINILTIYRILRKRFLFIFIPVSIITFLTLVISFFLPPVYRAQAVILPQGQANPGLSLAGIAGQLGMGLGLGGMGGGLALAAKLELMLKSQTLSERIARRFNLADTFEAIRKKEDADFKSPKDPEEKIIWAASVFHDMIKVIKVPANETGIIVAIDSPNPEIAPELVNALLDELNRYINDTEVSDAKRHRMFVGRQMTAKKREFLEAGKELADYYRRNRISASESVVDARIELPDQPDGPSQDDLIGLSRIPDVDNLSLEIKLLEDRLRNLNKGPAGGEVVLNIPQHIYLEYLTARKSILVQLNTLLAQQYEMAKIEEAKQSISFQIIDGPTLPTSPFKPKIKKNAAVAFIISLFLSVTGVFLYEYVQYLRKTDPAARA